VKHQRILITGGAGLVGPHIADLVVHEAEEVVILDNFARGRRESLASVLPTGRVSIVDGDIRNRRLVAEVMQGIDVLFRKQLTLTLTRVMGSNVRPE